MHEAYAGSRYINLFENEKKKKKSEKNWYKNLSRHDKVKIKEYRKNKWKK